MGRKNDALKYYEKGIARLEQIRNQTGFSKIKKTFLDSVYHHYREAAGFMLENGFYEKGFKYAGSMKARLFLDQLSEGSIPLEKGIDPDLKNKRDQLTAKLSGFTRDLLQLDKEDKGSKWQQLKESYRRTESEFEDLLIKIRLHNPRYAEVQYPMPVMVQELQEDVLNTDELLLQYFFVPDALYVFLVSKDDFRVLNISREPNHIEDIKSIINRYLIGVKESEKDMIIENEKMIKYGKELYQLIFKPLEAQLNGKKELIIVPDGDLETIPFEPFVIGERDTGDPVYLLEKYRIRYIQNPSTLKSLRNHPPRKKRTDHFIGFGDPVYNFKNYTQGHIKKSGRIWNRLKGSGQEIKEIAGIFRQQSHKAHYYLRANATEKNAKSADMERFGYIHFSSHGLLRENLQSLILSQLPQPINCGEDGFLTLTELMNCRYNAKLVVLSACKTGSGKVERGEGVTSLTPRCHVCRQPRGGHQSVECGR